MKNFLKILLSIIILIILGILVFNFYKNSKIDPNSFIDKPTENVVATTTLNNTNSPTSSTTFLYKNHGFSIELPKGYVVKEQKSEGGPAISISLPVSNLSYVTDSLFWEENAIPSYTYIKDEKIGQTLFKVYTYSGNNVYWFKQGKVGYEFIGREKVELEKLIETFKFIGWN